MTVFDESFDEELTRLAPWLVCYARRFGDLDPEDLAQDTLNRAWEKRSTFRQEGSLSSWLGRIMRNLALSEWRRPKVVTFVPELPDVSYHQGIEERIVREQLLEKLEMMIHTLSDGSREKMLDLLRGKNTSARAWRVAKHRNVPRLRKIMKKFL